MAKTLKEELEALHALGLTELRCAGKWLELLTAHVAALEVHREQDRNELMSHAGRLAALEAEVAALKAPVASASVTQWPTPQPIETAPLGQLMAWDPSRDDDKGIGPAWVHEYAKPGTTVEEWRALLKTWGCTHWLPMPPPPGGGK